MVNGGGDVMLDTGYWLLDDVNRVSGCLKWAVEGKASKLKAESGAFGSWRFEVGGKRR